MSHASANPWERTQRLLGAAALQRLAAARVAVFGVGGVGSYAVEALARSGVGHLLLVDADIVAASDINRQIHATWETIGQPKIDVMARRLKAINPGISLECRQMFYLPENAGAIDLRGFDCIVDAVDTVTAKIELIVRAAACGTPLVSCMGAGNKLDPARFRAGDIFDTSVCPLCRVMRRELRARGIKAQRVVWSDEPPTTPLHGGDNPATPGSIAFVPPAAGLIAAAEAVKLIIAAGNV
jgi:tRNA A37 threonylcarbamoyladenosine dehydratase